jgi:hypothetical protein
MSSDRSRLSRRKRGAHWLRADGNEPLDRRNSGGRFITPSSIEVADESALTKSATSILARGNGEGKKRGSRKYTDPVRVVDMIR